MSARRLPRHASVHHAFTISRRTRRGAFAKAAWDVRILVPSEEPSSEAGFSVTESTHPSRSLMIDEVNIVLMARFWISTSTQTEEYVPGLLMVGRSTDSVNWPMMLSFSYPAWSGSGPADHHRTTLLRCKRRA